MALNDIKVPKENAQGTFDEVVLSRDDIGAAPATGIAPAAISGTAVVDSDARLSDSRTPTAHAASHASAGSDPLAPSDIGAQSVFVNEDLTITTSAQINLTAARAKNFRIIQYSGVSVDIKLPQTGTLNGDVFVFRWGTGGNSVNIVQSTSPSVVASVSSGQQIRVAAGSDGTWALVPVDTHTHAASAITSGTLDIARIPTGTTAGTVAAGDDSRITGAAQKSANLSDLASASTARTNLGLGTAAVEAASAFAQASHTHELTALAATGATNGHVLTANGSNGVTFAALPASGVTGAASSASDVLGVSGANITGVDAGSADRLVFWDDSANKLTYLEAGSGLSISGTTLTATGGGGSGGTKTYAVFTAEHNQPPSTAFATLDTRGTGIAVLDFDAATDENAVFVGIMPEAASLGSGLIVRLHWMATSATSGNVRWGVQFERSNTDLDADSFDTAVEATAATNGTSGILTTTAITVTDFDGITAGDVFRLKVFRNADDATNDTMTGDAELVVVEVRSAA